MGETPFSITQKVYYRYDAPGEKEDSGKLDLKFHPYFKNWVDSVPKQLDFYADDFQPTLQDLSIFSSPPKKRQRGFAQLFLEERDYSELDYYAANSSGRNLSRDFFLGIRFGWYLGDNVTPWSSLEEDETCLKPFCWRF